MKLTWKNGASLLLELDNLTVLVNPAVFEENINPSVVIATGAGVSSDVLSAYAECGARMLLSESAYRALGDNEDAVLVAPHSVWSERGVTFYAVKAETADRTAVGVIIDDGDKTCYIAGSTLYHFDVIDDCLDLAPDGVDLAVLPISGKRCTMNARDAADFAYEIGAKCAVPVDYTDTGAKEAFDFDDAVILAPGESFSL
jgi:L-ascorbate metabolism protein UlaG (beta-lactamase superfamily)